jgi:drug/metabolite transporter (DMT)-like permease
MTAAPWLWIVFTLIAAASQTVRNMLQRSLMSVLGTVGATHIRFLYGLPFGILFLAIVLVVTGTSLPIPRPATLAFIALGALTQIGATVLMLAAMQERSLVVVTAYIKTEPILVAVFGLVLLGDPVTLGLVGAILLATAGVLLMTWQKENALQFLSARPALYGIASAGLFGFAAVGFRGGVTTLGSGSYIVDATTMLVVSLAIQTAVLSVYLALTQPDVLRAILKSWRQSMPAGFAGAFASQAWFLAFALESAARVRTLALVEIVFAQLLAGRFLKEKAGPREWLGIALVALGVVILLNG